MKEVYVKFVNGMDTKYTNVAAVSFGDNRNWDVVLAYENKLTVHLNKSQIMFLEQIETDVQEQTTEII